MQPHCLRRIVPTVQTVLFVLLPLVVVVVDAILLVHTATTATHYQHPSNHPNKPIIIANPITTSTTTISPMDLQRHAHIMAQLGLP
jgi:hypothetical protein